MHSLLMLAQASSVFDLLLTVWSTVWPYLVMLLGFSVIVFVHELGHFAVAKWAGVRVQTFAIGFGREIAGFTRGETRYSFNILPLGGYVKMLGQEDFDDKSNELRFKDDPRSFLNKPVGHRMAIVSAGVIMNTLFACLLFMVVFLMGMEAVAPRVDFIEPDSPAEKAGLLPGDYVRKINGETMLEFAEVKFAILLAPPHEPVEFIVERGGAVQRPLYIKPEYRAPETTRDFQRQVVGILPGVTREIVAVGPEIDTSKPDQPHVGDVLVEVDGVPATDDNASEIFNTLVYSRGNIYVERKDPKHPAAPPHRVQVQIPPVLSLYPADSQDPGSVSVLGLTPLPRFGQVDPRGRAALAGIDVGDTILRWDDLSYPTMAVVARAVRDRAEWDIPFRVRKADGRIVEGFVRPKRNKRGAATIQASCRPAESSLRPSDGPQAQFVEVRRGGIAAEAGLEAGDLVVRCNKDDNPTSGTVNRAIGGGFGQAVALTLRKRDGRVVQTYVQPQAPGAIDATFTLVADDLLQTGDIVPTINGRPSPAAEAGIPAGATITAVNDIAVSRWRDLIAALQKGAGTTVQLAYVDPTRAKRLVPFRVPQTLHTLLAVGPEARIVKIDGRETVSAQTARGTENLTVRYHEGTRAILTELIGRSNVPVEYRENPLSPLKTKNIDVTADMVDPWVGRIAFSPNIDVAPEYRLLKGENALDAVWIGIHKTYYFIRMVYRTMQRMFFTRTLSLEQMSGPLGIIDMGGQIARTGLVQFLFFLAMISANLAVINFLPLPIVDGGLMIFLMIEKIKGAPVSLRVQVATQMIGLFLIVGLFLFVTYQDVVRMWG
jgi:membrane-associated protease RseP (regulator of RpoE activity)